MGNRSRFIPTLLVAALAGLILGPGFTSAAAQGLEFEQTTSVVESRVPGEVLVGFQEGTSQAERQRLFGSIGTDEVDGIPGLPGARQLTLENGQTIAGAITELRREEQVAWVQPNLVGRISRTPDDPLFGRLWAFRNTGQLVGGTFGTADADTDLDLAWDIGTGTGARIAVVDTGIDPTNPDLATTVNSSLSRNFDASVDTSNVDPTDWGDQNGHGTHVAGTVAATGNNGIGVTGSSWDTDLVAVRACRFDGQCDSSTVASALAYAGRVGAKVVNVSLGFNGPASGAAVLRSAITQYPETLYVVAAGNDGVDVEQDQSWPCNLDLENVICVAATDQYDNLAGFSNRGSVSVDLAAPGDNILSTLPQISAKTDEFLRNGLSGWTPSPAGSWSPATLEGGGTSIKLNATSLTRSATLTTGSLDFSGGKSCSATYRLRGRFGLGQSLTQQFSIDGGASWRSPGPFGSITAQSGLDEREFSALSSWIGPADGKAGVLVRFRYASSGLSLQAPIVEITRPLVSCVDPQPAGGAYGIFSGTSMAAPQVTGAAALISGHQPQIGLVGLRNSLLDSVDQLPALAGQVATGGRLNVRGAMIESGLTAPPPDDAAATGGGGDANLGKGSVASLRILSVKRLRNGRARIRVRVSKAGRIWVKGTRTMVGRTKRVPGAATINFSLLPRSRVRRLIGRGHRARIRVTVGYRPVGGLNQFRQRWVTFSR